MSNWTHVTACLYVETEIEDKNIEEIIREKLKEAPEITGSEGSADVFVNSLSGHSIYTSSDCRNCPYHDTIKVYKSGAFSCDSPADFKCPSGEYQTRVCISVIGDLRDRRKERTKEEYNNFFRWIKANLGIVRQKTYSIEEY